MSCHSMHSYTWEGGTELQHGGHELNACAILRGVGGTRVLAPQCQLTSPTGIYTTGLQVEDHGHQDREGREGRQGLLRTKHVGSNPMDLAHVGFRHNGGGGASSSASILKRRAMVWSQKGPH